MDDTPSIANLSSAVTDWAKDATELIIYVTDHGGKGTFMLDGTASPSVMLTAEELNGWLNDLQKTMPGKVIVIYDACFSGSFLSRLTPEPGKERILITSSTADERAWFEQNGVISFSYQFWASALWNANLHDAFLAGKGMVETDETQDTRFTQTPQLDADGDGETNTKNDKLVARSIEIGRGRNAGSTPPSISSVSEEQTLTAGQTAATLSAKGVTSLNPVSRVWAVILPPDYQPGSPDAPIMNLPAVELTPSGGDGDYEGEYTGFISHGTYRVTVYARDSEDYYAMPVQTAVIQTEGVIRGDIDGDDAAGLADAILALRTLAGMNTSGLIRANYAASGTDVNGDGKVGFEEVFYLLKKVAGS